MLRVSGKQNSLFPLGPVSGAKCGAVSVQNLAGGLFKMAGICGLFPYCKQTRPLVKHRVAWLSLCLLDSQYHVVSYFS